jgi:type II secretory ATPase GspE/PulE/Tfp pilus assembly ATPase PilB-like protein
LRRTGARRCRSASASIDLRIASLPTSFGERVVIRLLDKARDCTT